uniref:Ragulator complex protein LAMTOR1 n=1 Tax=Sus scrofa TaxID=9823 RepID=A0A8D0PVB9_PIG
MGCCYSSENEDSDQDREERKLLLDPSSPPTKALNGAEPNYHSLPSARTDEQALLSSILAKTASNIIDVSAADSQGMEQHEYMDRARQYSTRLAVLSSSLTHWKKLPPLPSLTSQPHQVLASEPIPFSDLQQLSSLHPASTPPPRPPASLRLTQNPNLRRIPARGGGGGGEQGWKPEQVRMERGRVAAPGTGPRSPGQGGVGGTGTGPSPSLGRWRCHGDGGHRPLTGPLPTLSCLPPAPSPGLGAHVHLKGM